MTRKRFGLLSLAVVVGLSMSAGMRPALGGIYDVPGGGDTLFGALGIASTVDGDTLLDIARVYDQGYRELKIANPDVDVLLPGHDTEVVIPSLYLLPSELTDTRTEGIVVNVAEFRLYHRARDASGHWYVETYPISIGRQEWRTPHGATKIVAKAEDPTWYPPETVRREHEEWGDPLPRIVPPGDDNPLGRHALRLGLPGYLIHGTNRPYGIGMRVTHGCIRMYPADVERLFHSAPVGRSVTIINRPFKVGRRGEVLYLEAHPSLEGDADETELSLSGVVDLIARETDGLDVKLDWDVLKATVQRRTGIPTEIGRIGYPATAARSE